MSAKLPSQRRISPHEGQEGGSIGPASATASFVWRNGCASPGQGVDSCRQRSQIGDPGLNGGSSHRREPTVDSSFVDYYEALQLSPNADVEAIQRSYRMLAQRYHPDNTDTGNEAAFRLVLQACRVISDPEERAAYDVKHRASQSLRWKIFGQPEDAQGYDEEKRKRWGLLMILYTQRKRQPDKPGVALRELENMLGCPREQLQFTLWYLSGKSLIQPTDAGRYTITFDGVDYVEDAGPGEFPDSLPLLEAPRVVSEESTPPNHADS